MTNQTNNLADRMDLRSCADCQSMKQNYLALGGITLYHCGARSMPIINPSSNALARDCLFYVGGRENSEVEA